MLEEKDILKIERERVETKSEEKPVEKFSVRGKEIPEKEYSQAWSEIDRQTRQIKTRAVELWENSYPELSPEQVIRQALKELELEVK